MFERILVPTDGSEPAIAALEHTAEIASTTNPTLHVLYVDDSNGRRHDDASTAKEIISSARDIFRDVDVPVVDETRSGEPEEVILEYAAETDVDTIVMGTHGRRGIGRFLLGSVTASVIRNADVPVLSLRSDDEVRRVYPYGTVLVPTDGSVHSAAALDTAIEVASDTGATIHLISVVDLPPYGVDAETIALVDQLEAHARETIEAESERATEAGVDVETTITFGRTHREIRQYAEAEAVDLIAMGTHGRSGFDRLLLGSVTERVLRTAPAPVLTVRGTETDEA